MHLDFPPERHTVFYNTDTGNKCSKSPITQPLQMCKAKLNVIANALQSIACCSTLSRFTLLLPRIFDGASCNGILEKLLACVGLFLAFYSSEGGRCQVKRSLLADNTFLVKLSFL